MGKEKQHTLLDSFAEVEKLEIARYVKWLVKEEIIDPGETNQDKLVTDFLKQQETGGRKPPAAADRCICIKVDGKQCLQQKTMKVTGPDDAGNEKQYNVDFCDTHNRKPPQNEQIVSTCIGKKSDGSICAKPAKKELNDKWYCGTHFNKISRTKS